MMFENALKAMKSGKRIRRKSWADKSYYYEIREISYVSAGKAIFGEDGLIVSLDTDLILADDWEICDYDDIHLGEGLITED